MSGAVFTGKAMLYWANRREVALQVIEPVEPNQSAYVASFNGRFRDEWLNAHWFMSLAGDRALIEASRQEYSEERPKRSLGGLRPAQYAQRLATRPLTMPADSRSSGC